jgi:hypothetical protein
MSWRSFLRPYPNGSDMGIPAQPLSTAGTAPVATVLVLNSLRPVFDRLMTCLEGLSPFEAQRMEREINRNGAAAVHQGSVEEARTIEACLRSAGLTTSVNLLVTG